MISKVDCHAWKAIESILGMSAKMSDKALGFGDAGMLNTACHFEVSAFSVLTSSKWCLCIRLVIRSAILYSNCQNVTHHLATDWEPAVIDLCYITTTYNNPRESAVEKQFSLEISMQTQFSSCAHKERNEHQY